MTTFGRLLRDPAALVGAALTALLVMVAVLAPVIAPYDPLIPDVRARFQGPSATHLLGADELGRDILSRLLHGSRLSLLMSMTAVGIAAGGGVTFGLIAGLYRRLDNPIMRVLDVLLAFPGILFAVAIVAALGPGVFNGIMALGVHAIPSFARLTRAQVLSIQGLEYVTAARAVGVSRFRMLGRHILPNAAGPLVVYTTLALGSTIIASSSLSFLGLGSQPPTPDWGAMVAAARAYLLTAPHLAFFPAFAIFLTVLGFNFLGDGLRDALDPRINR